MRSLIKLFVLVIAFATFSSSFVQAQATRFTAKPTTPASVIKLYNNMKTGPCGIGFTMTTNEGVSSTSSLSHPLAAPTGTWTLGNLKQSNSGCATLVSTSGKRYWSKRVYQNKSGDGNPFNPNKTDNIKLTLKACGNTATATLISGNNTKFTIKILGVVKSKKGHVLYGTYGGHNGLITISLFQAKCPH